MSLPVSTRLATSVRLAHHRRNALLVQADTPNDPYIGYVSVCSVELSLASMTLVADSEITATPVA